MYGIAVAARSISAGRGRPVDFTAVIIAPGKSTLTTQPISGPNLRDLAGHTGALRFFSLQYGQRRDR
jgi:hypothetical protein